MIIYAACKGGGMEIEMANYELFIGKNIREVRNQRKLSQDALAKGCGFSNTTLSAYENGRKIPNLVTIAKIAMQLNVSIERLYYGDENNAFIISAPDEGRKIVNSIYFLWRTGVVFYYENYYQGMEYDEYLQAKEPKGMYVHIQKFREPIKRLLLSLDEFARKQNTYSDQDKYLELLFSSVSTEINLEIAKEKAELDKRREQKRTEEANVYPIA